MPVVKKTYNRWEARLKREGVQHYLGLFSCPIEAKAWVEQAREHYDNTGEILKNLKENLKSGMKGVYYDKKHGSWRVHDPNTAKYLASFPEVERAKEALTEYLAGKPIKTVRKPSEGSIVYYNYCGFKNHPKWCATIQVEGRKKHIGYYKEYEEASKALDDAKQGIFPEPKSKGRKKIIIENPVLKSESPNNI